MTHTITVQHLNSDKITQFQCLPTQNILDAALSAGLVLPYGCKNGACGSCKALLKQGTVHHTQDNITVEQAKTQGAALLCCAQPRSDVTVASRVAVDLGEYPVKKLPVRVASIQKLSHDVMVLRLQLPASEKLAFKAGQYLEFILRDASRRAYSMGNAPHSLQQVNQLELHIRHMPGGLFTDALFAVENSVLPHIKEKDILRVEVPQGSFYVRQETQKPMILLASGTGFAPIKSIIEDAIHTGCQRPKVLYWGGRKVDDLYMNELAMQWQANLPNFTYIPVLSENDTHWAGRTGFVHRAVMQDFPDLSGHEVYACGAPIVVNSARKDFVTLCGLAETDFYADSFVSQKDQ